MRDKANGIDFGFYWYSYAMSVKQAEAEAEKCVAVLKGLSPTYPVFFDMEENKQISGLNTDTRTKMAIAFCDKIKQAGFKPGIYANPSFMENYYDKQRIIGKYDIWLAHWTNSPDRPSRYNYGQTMWQWGLDRIDGYDIDGDICFCEYAKPTPEKKTVEQLADEVIAGKWDNGAERERLLTAAGYDYNAVQKRVNEKLYKKTVDELVLEVIRGDWGNGAERKKRLTADGYDYSEVQRKVNEKLDAKGEVLLTIMASLAQQESMSLSQNVKLGLQFRYQRGEVQVNHSRFLGYTKDENGRLVIDPEQAEVVRRIFREYLDGYSTDKIAAGLERDGILTGAGNPRWHTSTVAKILRNEKYMGDALLQKTYTVDYLSKKRIKNNGIMPQYYVENDHEAIIPKEIFMRVQDELVRRRLVKVSPNGKKHGFSSNHVFSQIVVCGECGEQFRRVHWNNHGCRSIVWRCLSRLQSTGVICHARTVNEEVLKNVVLQAFNELLGNKSTYQKRLQDNLAVVLRGYADDEALEIDKRLAELQQELINHASRKEDYNDIADEIFRLREMKQKNFTDSAVRDEQVKRINELNDFISRQDTELTEFDENLARRWLKEITVWSDRITVELKSGVTVEIEI